MSPAKTENTDILENKAVIKGDDFVLLEIQLYFTKVCRSFLTRK